MREPNSWWEYIPETYGNTPSAREVYEEERRAVKTGLLDKDGRPLIRQAPKKKIGFVHFGDGND